MTDTPFARHRPVAAIFRAPTAERFLAAADVLVDSGIQVLEFTLTSTGALDALAAAKKRYPADVLVGAGTVRSADHVRAAADAGADFLVSQVFNGTLVEIAGERRIPFVPGALTPNEIVAAWNSGAPMVKVSPVGPVGGVDYFSELVGPLPDIPLFPTGGVANADVSEYLKLGAAVVGLSRDLFRGVLTSEHGLTELGARAQQIVQDISVGAAA